MVWEMEGDLPLAPQSLTDEKLDMSQFAYCGCDLVKE